jgi:cytochrome b561
LLLFLLPISGWAMVSASPLIQVFPLSVFGLASWPAFPGLSRLSPEEMRYVHDLLRLLHAELLKFALVLLLVLHIGGAAIHIVRRDGVIRRMLP